MPPQPLQLTTSHSGKATNMNSRSHRPIRTRSGLILVALTVTAAAHSNARQPSSEAFPVESNLRVGVAKIDITPPPDAKVVGHVRPTHGARDPIRAAILLLNDGKTRAAIVTFDLIFAWDELVHDVREVHFRKRPERPRKTSWSPAHTTIRDRTGRPGPRTLSKPSRSSPPRPRPRPRNHDRHRSVMARERSISISIGVRRLMVARSSALTRTGRATGALRFYASTTAVVWCRWRS